MTPAAATRHWRQLSRSRIVTVSSLKLWLSIGDAKWRARFVLPPIPPADRPFFIVRDIVMPLELAVDRLGLLGHAVALHQRKDRRLDGRDPRMEFQHRARLTPHLVFGVCLAEKRQGRAVGAGRRFDHMRHEPLLTFFVEIAQVLAAELHVLAEVVVPPMRDPLQLALAERESVFDVGGGRRIERQLRR